MTIATASTLSTPAATGNAVSANTTLAAHDARMIARPAHGGQVRSVRSDSRERRGRRRPAGRATRRARRRSSSTAHARALPPSRRRSPGLRTSRSRVWATSITSPGSMTNPVFPSTTASCDPPLRPATDGSPQAAASRNTMPKPSASRPAQRSRHTIANTSPDRYTAGRSSSLTRPRNRTRAASPSRAARASRRRRSRPSPAMASCTSSSSSASASSRTSKPLRGTRRLTATTVGRSGSSPNRRARWPAPRRTPPG